MKTLYKLLIVVAVFAGLSVGLYAVILGNFNQGPEIKNLDQPHYLAYQGVSTKIYFFSATATYGEADSTYTSSEGKLVQKGTNLLKIDVVLRNDYSSECPPPPAGRVPMSPVDGTAYVFLSVQIFNQKGRVNATNVSLSDFLLPSDSGNGLVLASGQTGEAHIWLIPNEINVNSFDLSLIFLGDSIPT